MTLRLLDGPPGRIARQHQEGVMPRQRWGTFSVRDHQDAGQLIPEVLLYDRLIFPVPDGPGE